MWLFPTLSILTAVGILAILVQMAVQDDVRSQLILSLLSFAVVLVLFVVNKYVLGRSSGDLPIGPTGEAHRVLVLANETVNSTELLEELRRIDVSGAATYFVCVPASPVETGQASVSGPLQVWEATAAAAETRLEDTLTTLRWRTSARGSLGRLPAAAGPGTGGRSFAPGQIVIATRPLADSVWQRYDVVDRARSAYSIPVTHVIAASVVARD